MSAKFVLVGTFVFLTGFNLNRLAGDGPTGNDPVPPIIAPPSDEPEQALQAINVPENWQIDLYASEPQIANVVAINIDNRGRVFVCESFRQNRGVTDNREHGTEWLLADLAAKTVQDRIEYHRRLLGDSAVTYTRQDDRIRRLEDTDRDGKIDVSTVFADRFNRMEEGTGAGVLVRGDSAYYTCIPKLWQLKDSDDDGVADGRTALSDGYGVRVAFRGHDLHGLIIGPDGRLYFSIGDRGYHVATADGRVLADPDSGAVFRCELDGSGLEVYARGMRNPQEIAFNDLGDLFSVDNNSDSGDKARIIQILEGGDTGWRMYFQYLHDRGPFNRERIWEPLHDEQPAYLIPPIANFSDGPSGLVYYPGTGFGDELKNRFLLCDFRGTPNRSGLRTFQLEPDGAFHKLAMDDQPVWSVLATDVAFGPDGSLIVSDWVTGWNGEGKGRLYRITSPDYQQSPIVRQVETLLGGDWSNYPVDQLIEQLGHADQRIRLESQWELARRSQTTELLKLASDETQQSIARLHAIWGADQVARRNDQARDQLIPAIAAVLADPDAVLRAAAAKVLGERGDAETAETLRALLDDPSARVRYAVTLALGKLRDASSMPNVIRQIIENDNQDPALRHAAIMYLSRVKPIDRVVALASHENVHVRRSAVVALRRNRRQEVAQFLSDESELVALEAARAIHDVPILVAMPSLAEQIESPSENVELVRRILNANLRVGSQEAADRVAQYAASDSAPPEMRSEALDILENWNATDPRDRIVGAYRPLSERDPKIAAQALESQIDFMLTSAEQIREKAIEVAAKLGIKKIAAQIATRTEDTDLEAEQRAGSLRALADLDSALALQMAKSIPMRPANELTRAAVAVLAKLAPRESVPTFVEATKSRSVRLRQQAWDVLATIDSPPALRALSQGIEQYLAGSLPPDVHLNVLEAAKGKIHPDLQARLDHHANRLADSEPLARWLPALEGGTVDLGRKLFYEKTQLSCVRCHIAGLKGGEVGPKLNGIAKAKDRRYLLESICLPDATIAKGYETVVLADDSGQVHTGIVRKQTNDFMEIIQADGVERRIPLEEIVARRTGKSAMPSDLANQMTLRELRDLVAFLARLK